MTVSLPVNNILKKMNKTIVVIITMLICSLLTGYLPQNILSFVIVALCLVLFFNDELFLAYPFIIFYNELYGIVFGMSVSRLFSLMFVLRFMINIKRNRIVNIKYFVPLVVYILYSLFVVSEYSVQRAFFSIIDVLCCIILVSKYLKDEPEKVKKFFKVYVLVCLVAFFTGVVQGNIFIQGGVMPRFLATFEDPNYMGYFYTIAVFPLITLKLFKPWIRYLLVVLLYCVILSSLSMSAIVVNILLWLIFLTVTKNINVRAFVICLVVIFVLNGVYQYGLNKPETAVLGELSGRIDSKLSELMLGNMSDATTGRSDFSKEHFDYFLNQPFSSIIFGGTPVNTHYISPQFRAIAHNEYVDMLLNVGVLGTIALLGFTISNLIDCLRKIRQDAQNHYLCIFMVKCVWLAYGLTLTIFMDYRFMMPFFM